MPFPEDYVSAHYRHWTDAELLFQNSCWANADQLYGLSAECGVKALMPSLNMPVAKKHLDEIWPDFAKAATSALDESTHAMWLCYVAGHRSSTGRFKTAMRILAVSRSRS